MRIILVVVFVLLAAAGGLAVALHRYFGWKGLVAFPVLLVGLVWLGKIVVGRLVKRFFVGLFGMKAGVLRGASMTVHSIVPVAKPAEREPDPDPEDDSEDDDADEEAEPQEEKPEPDEPKEPEAPRVYYEIDVTITPRQKNCDGVWEPTELMLTSQPIKSLEDLEEQEVGTTWNCLLWDGSAFVEDEIGKHPGEQRLKLTMEVVPGTRQAWLYYYQEEIGPLELPEERNH